jgi:hypothetical protein
MLNSTILKKAIYYSHLEDVDNRMDLNQLLVVRDGQPAGIISRGHTKGVFHEWGGVWLQ